MVKYLCKFQPIEPPFALKESHNPKCYVIPLNLLLSADQVARKSTYI